MGLTKGDARAIVRSVHEAIEAVSNACFILDDYSEYDRLLTSLEGVIGQLTCIGIDDYLIEEAT